MGRIGLDYPAWCRIGHRVSFTSPILGNGASAVRSPGLSPPGWSTLYRWKWSAFKPLLLILSRFSPEAFSDPKDFKKLAVKVSEKIKSECPGVVWKNSYATLGQFDVLDIVESEDPKEVEKAAMTIRAYGHSTTETILATPWREFLEML